MKYEILNYNKYKRRIVDIINNPNNVNKVIDAGPLTYTRFGFPVDHFQIGTGDKHMIFLGGTHGNELTSIDFVTQLMEQIALGNSYFNGIDFSEITLDFFPLQNPEGFVISSSAVESVIKDEMSEWQIEQICHEYYEAFRNDDITASRLKLISSKLLEMFPREHQKIFQSFKASDLSKENYELREHIKRLASLYDYPAGSLVSWLANGSGVDLNANNPDNPRIKELYDGKSGFRYASGRYGNIVNNVPSPMGVPCLDKDHFEFEKENLALFEFIGNLHNTESYLALFTYHGTGGLIYSKPYSFDQSAPYFLRNQEINALLAERYGEVTGYLTGGKPFLDKAVLIGCGDMLRSIWPGVLLIELSKMGGNPIGPYGDYYSFLDTFERNVIAVSECIKIVLERKDELKVNYFKRKKTT